MGIYNRMFAKYPQATIGSVRNQFLIGGPGLVRKTFFELIENFFSGFALKRLLENNHIIITFFQHFSDRRCAFFFSLGFHNAGQHVNVPRKDFDFFWR